MSQRQEDQREEENKNQSHKSNSIQQPSQQQQQQPSLVEYKLDKVLNEFAQREQQYIQTLKKQQQKIYQITDHYSDVLSTYRKDIRTYIDNKQKQAKKKREHYERVADMGNFKSPPNKYGKKQYTKQTDMQLQCCIRFMYMTPVIKDYLKQKYLQKLLIKFRMYYPQRKQITLKAQINDQLEPQQAMNNIINGYPFQLYNKQKLHPSHKFNINHQHSHFQHSKILNYYKNQQLQIDIYSQQSGLLYCSGKINLEQLLYYPERTQEQEQWMEKIPLYSSSIYEPCMEAYLHIQFITKAVPKPQAIHIHKISQPLSLNRPNVNDKQGRLLQRISTYKSSQNSIIPVHNPQQNIDNNILLHRKKLQLQQIQEYKQKHKMQYMDKVIDNAMEQLKTSFVELGECKYLIFNYTNEGRGSSVQRLKISKTLKEVDGKASKQINNVVVQVLQSQSIHKLIKNQVLACAGFVQYSYDDDMILVAHGQTVIIVIKTIINRGKVNDAYNLTICLHNEYNELIHTDTSLLKVIQPIPVHIFTLYCQPKTQQLLSIHTPQLKSEFGKKKSVFIHMQNGNSNLNTQEQFEYSWNKGILDLRIKNNKLLLGTVNGTKPKTITFYLHIYDINYMIRNAVYEINILPCMKVQGVKNLIVGVVGSYQLLMQTPPNMENKLIQMGSSDVNQLNCKVLCMGKQSIVLQPSKTYPIDVRYQSFTHFPNPQKVVIQCIDSTTYQVLYRWLLLIPKQTSPYKHIYKLICPLGESFKFPYQLINIDTQKQNQYHMYSSNHSVLKVPTQKILLFGGQTTKIQLQIQCWQGYVRASQEEGKGTNVVMGVDDGKSILLYLFQLQIQQK